MPNHLADQTSPYLQQHADNPVDWYPWGEEALRLAKKLDKPILLSIGYSACHWCHVMAHECFEDPEIATAMNEYFVNIKVDREERPDLDQIYQTAHYLLTQRSGGWPLNMFLSPEQIPFFGGTYFPKTPRHNLPGFGDLLPKVAEFYHKNAAAIASSNASLLQALEHGPIADAERTLSEAPIRNLSKRLARDFDAQHGGFGGAPKFPHPTQLEFLLREYGLHGDESALHMVTFSLKKMALGGIYDQLGGGFSRYSVDERWVIPHFEKMLYDNGPLLLLYADAYVVTDDPLFRDVIDHTAAWVMREMQSPQGGYYSALDADSEHVEGKFYVWTPQEIKAELSPDEYEVAAFFYGLDQPANFEHSHWHLNVARDFSDVATQLGVSAAEAQARLASARKKLFSAREKRIHPGRDEKVLTSWNALMIKGMAHAARICNEPGWLASAQQACDFIHASLWQDGRLLATYKDGRAHLNAYLDDYAFLLDALLELMQAKFRPQDLAFALLIADALLEKFEDEKGGFFFTSHDHEKLIHRLKIGHDNATPSGDGVAALSLQRLGYVVGETRYIDAAARTVRFFYPAMAAQAGGFDTLLMALDSDLRPPKIVILRGEEESLLSWKEVSRRYYHPNDVVLSLPAGLTDLPPALNKPSEKAVHAWVCAGGHCWPALTNLAGFEQLCKDGRVR